MLMNCANLAWDVKAIVRDLDDGKYSYEELIHELCILPDSRKQMILPFEWNSLEHYEEGRTSLIHYTDMPTQPWVSNENPNGHLWYALLRGALDEGFIAIEDVYREIREGHVCPELPLWVGLPPVDNMEELRKRWMPPYLRLLADRQKLPERIERSRMHLKGLLSKFKRLLPYGSS